MSIVNDPKLATVHYKFDRLVPNAGKLLHFPDGTITRGSDQAFYKLTGKTPPPRKKCKRQLKTKRVFFKQQLEKLIKEKDYFLYISKTKKIEALLNNYKGTARSFLGCFFALCGAGVIKCVDIDIFIKAFCSLTRINFAILYRRLEKGYRERKKGNTALYRVSEINRSESRYRISFHKCVQKYYGIYEFLWASEPDVSKHKKQKKTLIENLQGRNSSLPKVILIKRDKNLLHKP